MLYLAAICLPKFLISGCLLNTAKLSSPNTNILSKMSQLNCTHYLCTCMLVMTLPIAVVACPDKRCMLPSAFENFDFNGQYLCI